jgi:hypothetical protein
MMVMLTLIMGGVVDGLVVMVTGDGALSRDLGGVFVDLALQNQGCDPDGLDYRKDERGDETRDECRK